MDEIELDKLVRRLEARAEARNWKSWLQLFNGLMMFVLAGTFARNLTHDIWSVLNRPNLLDQGTRVEPGLGDLMLISFLLGVGAFSICTAVVELRCSSTDKLLLHLLKLEPSRRR